VGRGNGWVPCTHLAGNTSNGARIAFVIGTMEELAGYLGYR